MKRASAAQSGLLWKSGSNSCYSARHHGQQLSMGELAIIGSHSHHHRMGQCDQAAMAKLHNAETVQHVFSIIAAS